MGVFCHFVGQLIQEWLFRTPQLHALHGQHDSGAVGTRNTLLCHHFLSVGKGDSELIVGVFLIVARCDDELLLVDVGHSVDRLQGFGVNSLQPDGLPDACGAGVHAAIGVEQCTLLASRLVSVAQVVDDLYDEIVFTACLHMLRNVAGERGTAAIMATHKVSIDEDMRFVVDGTEVQQNLFVRPSR